MESRLVTRPRGDVAPYAPDKPADIEQERRKYRSITQKQASYSVSGQNAPTVRIAREWAKEDNISHEIVDCGKTKDSAWSQVRGWIGPKDAPEMVVEAKVVHVFSHMLIESVFDAIANGIKVPSGKFYPNSGSPIMETYRLNANDWQIGDEGWPVILNAQVQFQLLRNHLAKIKIAERDATGKAERSVILKLLGKEESGETGHEGTEEENGIEEKEQRGDPLDRVPTSFEEAREIIKMVVAEMCEGNMLEAANKLEAISKVGDKYPAVNRLANIVDLEHANEIIARLRQEKLKAQKPSEAKEAEVL